MDRPLTEYAATYEGKVYKVRCAGGRPFEWISLTDRNGKTKSGAMRCKVERGGGIGFAIGWTGDSYGASYFDPWTERWFTSVTLRAYPVRQIERKAS
jgi:hypothetical protein